jgi:hypothetical protein
MVQRGQIVTLPTVTISPSNTPVKKNTETLVAKPRWKYVGPAETIDLEWQIGKMNSFFNGITARAYSTASQPASPELADFSGSLPAISLSSLDPGYYDCEIWFKDGFADLRVIVKNCVKIEAAPAGYSLEVTAEPPGTGSVTISPSKSIYSAGEKVTLTAKPASGYEFDYWGGYPSYAGQGSTSPTITITMDQDLFVVAVFKEKALPQYTLSTSVSPSGAGSISPSSGSYESGTAVTLNAIANSGYKFDHWGGDASGSSPTITITMNKNKSVVAYFTEVETPPEPEFGWFAPGNYSQIGISVAPKVPVGNTVEVEIVLKNITSDSLNMWPGSTRYNGTIFRVYDSAGLMHVVLDSGEKHSWYGSFTMPNKDVTILVESWYEGPTQWYADYSVTLLIRKM